MKSLVCFLSLFFLTVNARAQTHLTDSLQVALSKTSADTSRINLLLQLSRFHPGFTQRVAYANKGLSLARKINDKDGEARALAQLGGQYRVFGNYPLALHYTFSALRVREQANDTPGMARGYFTLGLVYEEMGDLKNALAHVQRAIQFNAPGNTHTAATANAGVGSIYYKLGQLDSALHYYQKSYEKFSADTDKFALSRPLTGLGDIQFKKGNNELAIGYYRTALQNCAVYADTNGYMTTYRSMTTLFQSMQQRDSTLKYGKLTLQCAAAFNNYAQLNNTATTLSNLYQHENVGLSLHYLQIAKTAADSVFSIQQSGQLHSLFLEQKAKEKAAVEQTAFASEQNRQDTQFTLIIFAIVSFIIVFLLFSHSIIATTKTIGILSGISLLLVFEFLNLLVHPFLERVTHHSPVLMLLGLVAIAALLVPLHHKTEHWATLKLVEKNKAIRLAAAKKTIEQLDKKENVYPEKSVQPVARP